MTNTRPSGQIDLDELREQMDKGWLDQFIACANEEDPLDLTHIDEARFVRDHPAPCVVLLWHPGGDPNKVKHYFAKVPELETTGTPDEITLQGVAFWIVQPKGGFRIVTTPNGPMTEEFVGHRRPDGKSEILGPTECDDCRMKTGIRGEWFLVHDHVWEQAWPNSKTMLATGT